MPQGETAHAGIVRAAGGILWRLDGDEPRLAVIHRPKRGDWSLPKGKLEPGESFVGAAIREVEEETQCRVRLGHFAADATYVSRGRDKLVLFWHMTVERAPAFVPNGEVDALEWLTPDQALLRLDHAHERDVLASALDGWREGGGAGLGALRAVAAAAP